MEDTRRAMLTKMLTDRMRHAIRQMNELSDNCALRYHPDEYKYAQAQQAADEEVRDCIREIARACHFENDCVDAITGEAWSKSKEE